MRLILYLLLSSSLLLSSTALTHRAAAQVFVPTPVEISKQKVNLRGSIYYVHKVLHGQTLYSISKVYGIPLYDLNSENPALKDGLKTGMILYIPVKSSKPESEQKEEEKTAVETEQKTVSQTNKTIDKKENKKSSKKEKKSRNSEDAIRPAATVPAATGKTQKNETDQLPTPSGKYRRHNLRWYENLEDVAIRYNVTVESICLLNGIDPGKSRKQKIKTVLIPDEAYMRSLNAPERTEQELHHAVAAAVPAKEKRKKQDSSQQQTSEQQKRQQDKQVQTSVQQEIQHHPEQGSFQYIFRNENSGHHTISVVLPLNASRNTDDISQSAADFCSGILMAAKDLKEKGRMERFTLNIVDLNRYASAWDMLSTGVLEGSSLIIGPFLERDLHPVSTYARTHSIPVVSPLDLSTRHLGTDNPYFFLYPPRPDLALKQQIDHIASITATERSYVTVIFEKGYEHSDIVTETFNELDAKNIGYRKFSYEMLKGRGIDKYMMRQLDSTHINRVIIPSKSDAFISDALRNLHLIKSVEGYKIEVYGMSRWKNSKTLDVDYFHHLDMRITSPYHIDYNAPVTDRFIREYREAFNAEPTPYSYQGYDILTYFTDMLNQYGNRFLMHIHEHRAELLQSDVMFRPMDYGSGFENCALRDIHYSEGWVIEEE